MKKLLIALSALSVLGAAPMVADATPESDLKNFRAYFFKKFPGVKLQDYGNGIYALDEARRGEWENIEEFPPYEDGIELGKSLFNKYGTGSCFTNGGIGIKQN